MTPTHPGIVVAGRFEVLRAAGSGGMGVVYQARDRQTDRAVALKVLVERDAGPADRFAQEVELLSSLEHPNIVGYVSHGVTEDGAPYLVMPWLEGIDLQARLREGPLSIDETIALARRVADALAYLHGRGLVHRDLKPSNLFLPDGKVDRVQVIDLGVARESVAVHAMTLSGVLVGTPGFIAPEQARGDREVAPAVDIFALGCVLFECLTGQRLFSGAHLMSVLAKILLEDAPRVRELRPDAPSALDLLVHRMVAKEPEKRPRDGAHLVQWLADLDRSPPGEGRTSSTHAITGSERRVATVLVVVLPPTRASLHPQDDETRVEADPFRSSSSRFGVRAQMLAQGTAIVLAPVGMSAADQAALLARFAHNVLEMYPGARVALTTGSAITGSRLPFGEAIERAVTMVRAGTPLHGVQIDDVTAALITSRFDVRREGGGLLVDAERLSLDPTRPLLGHPTPCVGRERELAMLEATLAECADGNGPKVVLVTAPAGAGKSRLRHELVRRLHASATPPRVLQCRGDPMHVATPYAMIAQAVRQAAGLREREPPESVREKLLAHLTELGSVGDQERVKDFLGELVGEAFDDRGNLPLRAARLDAVAMADQIGRAFEDILRAWCAQQPMALALEDLHWSDAASMKLLDRALRNLAGANLFVLALARPEVHERFPALFTNRDVTEVRLAPIPKRACAKLVQEVMGPLTPLDEVRRLVERSEGNGFYLEELIRAAAEQPRRSSTPPPSSRDADLPETVIAVAQARLERLEPKVRKVLRAASIYGDAFRLEGVSALVGEDPAAIASIIAALIEQEAIVSSEQPRLAGVRELGFRHTLLRATAYATLTDEDRVLGHRLAAEWLQSVGEDSEIVALHWLDAGQRTRAAASFTLAGEARWSRAQADAAARCAARALLVGDAAEAVETIGARVRLLASALEATRVIDTHDVLTGLRIALPSPAAGEPATAVHAALDRSLRELRTRADRRALSAVLADAASALSALSDFAGANRLLSEASLRASEDVPALRVVRYAAAKVAFWSSDGRAALDLLAESVLPDEPRERIEMLLMLAWAVVLVDGHPALTRGLDLVSRAESVLDDCAGEDPVARVHCARARVTCLYFSGEYAEGAKAAEAAAEIARLVGLRFDECAQLHNAGDLHLRLGDRDRALVALEASNRIAQDIGAERNQKHNDVLLAYLAARTDHLGSLAEGARAANDPWLELYARYWLGQLLASTGAPNAHGALEQALRLAGDLKARTMADDCLRAIAGLGASA